jgi:predicted RNase H-like HicB family nuclease
MIQLHSPRNRRRPYRISETTSVLGGNAPGATLKQALLIPQKRIKMPGMKFLTTLVRDEDGVWIAECPSIPGCVSQGGTRDEAVANIREAIAACLEVRAERGMPLTVETQQVEVAV